MPIISSNEYLSREQAYDNASYIFNYFIQLGWTSNSIAGMLGNMQRESTINPGVWQNLDYENYSGGFGLVQWTPATNLTDWASQRGLDRDQISTQCAKIQDEFENGGQWIPTSEYPISFSEFSSSQETPETLAEIFCLNYERAGVSAMQERRDNARYWYDTLSQLDQYHPRLQENDSYWGPIQGSKYYYSDNIFYLSGWGLPNCTCYAWGRRYELTDKKPTTSLNDAYTWWQYNIDNNIYPYSSDTPKLGAIACWYDNSNPTVGGHVGIVEQINSDTGDIICSNSGYPDQFFYVTSVFRSNGYNTSGFTFQGFIYLKHDYNPPVTSDPEISSVTSLNSSEISITGSANSTSNPELNLYIKWNSSTVSTVDYSLVISVTGDFAINVKKPRTAKSVSILPVRIGDNVQGAVYTATNLIFAIPCINIHTNGTMKQSIPYIWSGGTWKQVLPVLRTNNEWKEIWNVKE